MPRDIAARNQEMKQQWDAGTPVGQIAEKHGLAVDWTKTLLRRMGAELPATQRKRKRQLDGAQLAKDYNKGKSVRTLAAAHGVSYGAMHRYLQEAGVQMRPRGNRAPVITAPGVLASASS